MQFLLSTAAFLSQVIVQHFPLAGADPGFWSGGPSGVLTPRGALSPKFARNMGFSLEIA